MREGAEGAKEPGKDREASRLGQLEVLVAIRALGDGPGTFSLKLQVSCISQRSIAAQQAPWWPWAHWKGGCPLAESLILGV